MKKKKKKVVTCPVRFYEFLRGWGGVGGLWHECNTDPTVSCRRAFHRPLTPAHILNLMDNTSSCSQENIYGDAFTLILEWKPFSPFWIKNCELLLQCKIQSVRLSLKVFAGTQQDCNSSSRNWPSTARNVLTHCQCLFLMKSSCSRWKIFFS